jgi:hypothetical protein
MTFGILTQLLPISDTGEYNLEHVQQWVESRQHIEALTNTSTTQASVSTPGPLDVLLGRDKVAQNHAGNIRYLHLIESHKEQYNDAIRFGKKRIAMKVMKLVKDSGGCFLQLDGTKWVEIDEDAGIEKTCAAFRSRRKLDKRAEPDQAKSKRKVPVTTTSTSTIPCISTATLIGGWSESGGWTNDQVSVNPSAFLDEQIINPPADLKKPKIGMAYPKALLYPEDRECIKQESSQQIN